MFLVNGTTTGDINSCILQESLKSLSTDSSTVQYFNVYASRFLQGLAELDPTDPLQF